MNPKDLVGAKKAPLGLVPPALEIGAAEAMANGAAKYGPFNWRDKPVEYMTYLVALKRHIAALIDGEDYAEDSGIHHLHHIAAGVGILIDANNIPGDLLDNRPSKGPAARMLQAQDKSTPIVPKTMEEAGITAEDIERVADQLRASKPRTSVPYRRDIPGSVISPLFDIPDPEDVRATEIERMDTMIQGERLALCVCPPSRWHSGDHLFSCVHFDAGLYAPEGSRWGDDYLRDVPEPYRDVGGEG